MPSGGWWSALRRYARSVAPRIRQSEFRSQVVGTFASKIYLIALGLVSSILTSRLLGPDGRGAFAVMITVGAVGVQFGNLGLPSAAAYFVASDRRRLPALVGTSLLCGLVFGGILAFAFWAAAMAVPAWAPLDSPILLAWAVAWIPLGIVLALLQNLLLGIRDIRLYNGLQVAQKSVGVVLLLALAGLGVVGVKSFYLASFAVLVAGSAVALSAVLRHAHYKVTLPDRAFVRSAVGYGFRAYLATLFAYLVLQFDLLMVASMLGDAAAGYYSIAARMAEMLYMLPVALGTILFTKVASMHEGRWRFARSVTLKLALLLLPLLIIAGVLAQPVTSLLFGEAFLPAVPAFWWLLPGIYLLSINTVLMNYFAGTGMPLVTVISPGIAAAANVGANLYLLPRVGIVGASIASTLAYALMLLASVVYLSMRRTGQAKLHA